MIGVGSATLAALALTLLGACKGPAPTREPDTLASVGSIERREPSLDLLQAGNDTTAVYYRLVGVDTVGLPDSAGCGATIATAGALLLREDQRWRSGERAQYDCAKVASVVVDSGSYSWRGDTLELRSTTAFGADGSGLRRGDTLMVDFGLDALYIYLRRP